MALEEKRGVGGAEESGAVPGAGRKKSIRKSGRVVPKLQCLGVVSKNICNG